LGPAVGRADPPGLYRGRRETGEPELGPDTVDAGKEPGMAGLRAWRRPDQPARHPRPLPVVAILPHPWYTRHAQDRSPLVERLHRALQRTYRGSFRPDAGRDASEADLAR